MPFSVRWKPTVGLRDWAVVKTTTGEVIGRTTSNRKANLMKQAIQISESKRKLMGK